MKFVLIVIRIYWWVVIAWALSTWFPILPAPLTSILWTLTWPVWKLFGWAQLGAFNLGPVIFLLLLWFVDSWLTKQVQAAESPGTARLLIDDDEPQDGEHRGE